MSFFEQEGNALVFRENGETVRLTPWGSNSFRVEGTFMGDIPEESAALLPQDACESLITIEDRHAEIRNGLLTARLDVDEWGNALTISYYHADGRLLLSEINNGGALQRRARYYRPLQGGGYYLKNTFFADREEKLYGMGQYQQEVFDLKGCNLELAQRNSQASVPFVVSSRGYGFFWNNAAIGEVHFGLNTTEWEARDTDKLDYWITTGSGPKEIERNYADVTGHAPMMPEYGLGFWQCRLRYWNQEMALEIAREYHRRKIPVDVFVIDFYHWPRCGDWRFDPECFPDPKAMIEEIKSYGMETMVSFWPQVDSRSENYDALKQKGLLVRSNGGVDVQMLYHGNNAFLDVTNPRAREYAFDIVKKNYSDLGIRTFWLDEAEPEFVPYDYEQYRYHAGPVVKCGNMYPREYARMFYEGQKKLGQEDIVNLLRCAWAGSQRYGVLVWSGDIHSSYEDFRKQICAGLHIGLAGIPWWTTDIGGFKGGNIYDEGFRELLMRWFQFGAFCPVMRIHGRRLPSEPIYDSKGEEREECGAGNEIWSFGEECEKIMVKFIGIRTLMKDYIRDTMREAHEYGDPVMRTLFYEFPEDPNTWDIRDEYCFGSDILAAPVVYPGARSRTVYLPAGASWTHAGSGRVYEGGQSVEVEAPIDTMPVFLRDGRQAYLIGQI